MESANSTSSTNPPRIIQVVRRGAGAAAGSSAGASVPSRRRTAETVSTVVLAGTGRLGLGSGLGVGSALGRPLPCASGVAASAAAKSEAD